MFYKNLKTYFIILLCLFVSGEVLTQEQDYPTHLKDKSQYFFLRTGTGQWTPATVGLGIQMPNSRFINNIIAGTGGGTTISASDGKANVGPANILQVGFRIDGRLWGIRGETFHETNYATTKSTEMPQRISVYSSGAVGLNLYESYQASQFRYNLARNFYFLNANNPATKYLGLRAGMSLELNRSQLNSTPINYAFSNIYKDEIVDSSFSGMLILGLSYKYEINAKHVVGFSYDLIHGQGNGQSKQTLGYLFYNSLIRMTIPAEGGYKGSYALNLSGNEFRFNYSFLNIGKNLNLIIGYTMREVTYTVDESKMKGEKQDSASNQVSGQYFLSLFTRTDPSATVLPILLASGLDDLGPLPKAKDKLQFFSIGVEHKF